jgi:hypothetical protein
MKSGAADAAPMDFRKYPGNIFSIGWQPINICILLFQLDGKTSDFLNK